MANRSSNQPPSNQPPSEPAQPEGPGVGVKQVGKLWVLSHTVDGQPEVDVGIFPRLYHQNYQNALLLGLATDYSETDYRNAQGKAAQYTEPKMKALGEVTDRYASILPKDTPTSTQIRLDQAVLNGMMETYSSTEDFLKRLGVTISFRKSLLVNKFDSVRTTVAVVKQDEIDSGSTDTSGAEASDLMEKMAKEQQDQSANTKKVLDKARQEGQGDTADLKALVEKLMEENTTLKDLLSQLQQKTLLDAGPATPAGKKKGGTKSSGTAASPAAGGRRKSSRQ